MDINIKTLYMDKKTNKNIKYTILAGFFWSNIRLSNNGYNNNLKLITVTVVHTKYHSAYILRITGLQSLWDLGV